MRIYFLTDRRAALKLNGEYLGVIDGVERFVDLPDGQEVLAEVIPAGEYLPCSFFIGQRLFENPPYFLNVYLSEDGALVYVTHFERADRGLNILEQTELNGLGATLLELGGKLYLSCDGQKSHLYPLPPYFENCRLTSDRLGGLPVIVAAGERGLCLVSAEGKKLYSGQADSYSIGDMLGVTVNFRTSAGYFARREYSYNGQELQLIKNAVDRRYKVESATMHFAFFEALLYGADCSEYLSGDMQGTEEAMKEYLGDYSEVLVPRQAFYDKHGDIMAAALAYPIRDNLFEIKYCSVEIVNGKIGNVNRID
ncbi:MAG: hypothetical protein ACI4QI_02050 [Candidatus Coproplasma sp.]